MYVHVYSESPRHHGRFDAAHRILHIQVLTVLTSRTAYVMSGSGAKAGTCGVAKKAPSAPVCVLWWPLRVAYSAWV
jgi:hypothetical protein